MCILSKIIPTHFNLHDYGVHGFISMRGYIQPFVNIGDSYLRSGVSDVQVVQRHVLNDLFLFVDVAFGQRYVLLGLEVVLGGERVRATLPLNDATPTTTSRQPKHNKTKARNRREQAASQC